MQILWLPLYSVAFFDDIVKYSLLLDSMYTLGSIIYDFFYQIILIQTDRPPRNMLIKSFQTVYSQG